MDKETEQIERMNSKMDAINAFVSINKERIRSMIEEIDALKKSRLWWIRRYNIMADVIESKDAEIARLRQTVPAHVDPTGTTREPPHCPTCSCGLKDASRTA